MQATVWPRDLPWGLNIRAASGTGLEVSRNFVSRNFSQIWTFAKILSNMNIRAKNMFMSMLSAIKKFRENIFTKFRANPSSIPNIALYFPQYIMIGAPLVIRNILNS